MPANLQTRLRSLMRNMGWSQADLAKASGAAKQTVSDWMNDGPIKMDPEFAFRLQDKSGFSVKWLLLGRGPVNAIDFAKEIIRQHGSGRTDTSPKRDTDH